MPEDESSISSIDDVRLFVCERLAEIRATTVEDIEQQIQEGGGDIVIASPEGTSIAHGLESRLERDLVKESDLLPQNFASIEQLSKYLHRSLQRPARKKRSR